MIGLKLSTSVREPFCRVQMCEYFQRLGRSLLIQRRHGCERGSPRKSADNLYRTEGNTSLSITLWVLTFLSRVHTREGEEMWSIHLWLARNSMWILGEAWLNDEVLTPEYHANCVNSCVVGLELVQKWEDGTDRFPSYRCSNLFPKPWWTFLLCSQGPVVFCRNDASFRFLLPVVIFGEATGSESVPLPLKDEFDELGYPRFVELVMSTKPTGAELDNSADIVSWKYCICRSVFCQARSKKFNWPLKSDLEMSWY